MPVLRTAGRSSFSVRWEVEIPQLVQWEGAIEFLRRDEVPQLKEQDAKHAPLFFQGDVIIAQPPREAVQLPPSRGTAAPRPTRGPLGFSTRRRRPGKPRLGRSTTVLGSPPP